MKQLIVIVAFLLLVPEARPRTVAIPLDWNEMRTVIDHADPRRKVRVWTGADGKKRIGGRLARISSTELEIDKGRESVSLKRREVHSIKLFPSKTHNRGHRRMVAIFSVPIAIGAFFGTMLSSVLVGGYPEGPGSGWAVYHVGAMLGVPWALWQLARKADRGSILIILNKGTATGI